MKQDPEQYFLRLAYILNLITKSGIIKAVFVRFITI